jgi:hypothetical protein
MPPEAASVWKKTLAKLMGGIYDKIHSAGAIENSASVKTSACRAEG